jgi:hypothetical protein
MSQANETCNIVDCQCMVLDLALKESFHVGVAVKCGALTLYANKHLAC